MKQQVVSCVLPPPPYFFSIQNELSQHKPSTDAVQLTLSGRGNQLVQSCDSLYKHFKLRIRFHKHDTNARVVFKQMLVWRFCISASF